MKFKEEFRNFIQIRRTKTLINLRDQWAMRIKCKISKKSNWIWIQMKKVSLILWRYFSLIYATDQIESLWLITYNTIPRTAQGSLVVLIKIEITNLTFLPENKDTWTNLLAVNQDYHRSSVFKAVSMSVLTIIEENQRFISSVKLYSLFTTILTLIGRFLFKIIRGDLTWCQL